MIVPTDIIDMSQRIQREQMINQAKQLPAFEALKPNVEKPAEVEVVAPNLGSILAVGDKVNPIPDPAVINSNSINNENCTEDCGGSCTDCECQMPEGGSAGEGCSEGCDMQECADKQESNCDCSDENATENSKEEIGELLREKRCCCCGCCDCCCCCGCCGK
uniref:Metallothionein n=1 Tax=Panagrolaimus sp. ES5 TaxID=591445 RepID=A0AC34F9Q2_9BILA